MYSVLTNFLSTYKTKTVTLSQLEALAPGSAKYADFIRVVKALEEEQILVPVKANGVSAVAPGVANAYRVQKANLHNVLYEKIRRKQRQVNPLIDLTAYFSLPEGNWDSDQDNIDRVDRYLGGKGLPAFAASAPERSYELAGDEKWLQEGGGEAFLQRVGLYSKMKLTPVPDPLMLAVNPQQMPNRKHYHLIVENKTAYHALAGILAESPFTTLIYGAGKGFLNSILYLERQLNLPDSKHLLYYFGDLDLEGIKIWFMLNKVRSTELARAFYRALLAKPFQTGKLNHKKDWAAYASFLACFSAEEQSEINILFEKRGYCPQEALSSEELCCVWRESWKAF